MKRVIVHIDRLLLDGFHASDREGIAAGLRSELGRLLSETSTNRNLASLGNRAVVKAGTIPTTSVAKPEATGVGAARAIVRGLGR